MQLNLRTAIFKSAYSLLDMTCQLCASVLTQNSLYEITSPSEFTKSVK